MTWEHSDNYLIHYGVKGQKHGIRRYQNEDGSLTAEGRDHYGVGDPRKDGRSGEASNPKKKTNKGVEKQKRIRKAYKVLGKVVKVGAAAALIGGASAYAFKKSTKLRDEMRKQAGSEAVMARVRKNHAMFEARKQLAESTDLRDQRRIHPNDPYKSPKYLSQDPAFRQNWAHDWIQEAKKRGALEKKYTDIHYNATRRDAVKNYMRNKRKIIVD